MINAFITFIAIVFALIGCSLIPKLDTESAPLNLPWSERKNLLSSITHWQLSGRFGAKTKDDSWSGSISWSQQQQQYNIKLSGPLATGSVEINGDEHYSELTISDEESYGASNAEELLELHTGLRLPMNNLKYWLLGLPSPKGLEDNVEFDEYGRLKTVAQQGWTVTFRRYAHVNNIELPNKIFLINHEFDVRLVIQDWRILT